MDKFSIIVAAQMRAFLRSQEEETVFRDGKKCTFLRNTSCVFMLLHSQVYSMEALSQSTIFCKNLSI